MKNIVLAAGYATRLFPLTENFPKPLLEIGGKTILDRLLEDIDQQAEIDEHIIVTNHKFIDIFKKWSLQKNYSKKLTLLDDGSTNNENRLGAVKDLMLAIDTLNLYQEDLMVMAADNLVDFSFRGFIDAFRKTKTSMILCYNEPDLKALQRTGVIVVDSQNFEQDPTIYKVISMSEKPLVPPSNWAVPPFYIYKKDDLAKIYECINEGINTDAPGSLVQIMLEKTIFYSLEMSGKRIDIGTIEQYKTLS